MFSILQGLNSVSFEILLFYKGWRKACHLPNTNTRWFLNLNFYFSNFIFYISLVCVCVCHLLECRGQKITCRSQGLPSTIRLLERRSCGLAVNAITWWSLIFFLFFFAPISPPFFPYLLYCFGVYWQVCVCIWRPETFPQGLSIYQSFEIDRLNGLEIIKLLCWLPS